MTSRITTRRGWLGGLLAVLLGTMAWPAMGDEPASKPAKAVLTGLIENQAGEPLAEARVRVGIPAIDMRFIDEKPNLHLFEAVTDAKGR